ncbi:LOW QUALITY PROTEIN: hypothetical protein HID58_044850, partial [Brassica napus]
MASYVVLLLELLLMKDTFVWQLRGVTKENRHEKDSPNRQNRLTRMGNHRFVEYMSGGPQPGGMFFPVAHGVHAARKRSNDLPEAKVKPGSLYSLTFGASRTCAQEEVLRVSVPPQTGDLPLQTLYNSFGGDVYAWAFVPKTSEVTFKKILLWSFVDAVAIKELVQPTYTEGNLVKNGGFEEGPHRLVNSTQGVLLPPKQEDTPRTSNVPFGQAAIELVAGKESAIAQVIRTSPVGGGHVKTASLKFKALEARTRITFFSGFYHTKKNDIGSLVDLSLIRLWFLMSLR